MTDFSNEAATAAALALLESLGFNQPQWRRVARGRNNRVFQAVCGDRFAAVKEFFFDEADPRNRFEAETQFCQFASTAAPHCTPALLAADPDHRLAVYEWIAGEEVSSPQRDDVKRAAEFFAALNSPNHGDRAALLPLASEACFTIESHCECVTSRVERLLQVDAVEAIAADMLRWVKSDLAPALHRATARAKRDGDGGQVDIPRVVSPSDFGFHNCLRRPTGQLTFVDFEYAGWDDPAKTICDFFQQVDRPAPRECWSEFAEIALQHLPNATAIRQRAVALQPLYVVKWCCIALNEFHCVDRVRRTFGFAADEPNSPTRLAEQLATAQQILTNSAD